MKYDLKEIGERIAELRKERNMLQYELANDAGLSPTAMSNYERGIRKARIIDMAKIADALQVSLDTILGREPVKVYGMDPFDFEDSVRKSDFCEIAWENATGHVLK